MESVAPTLSARELEEFIADQGRAFVPDRVAILLRERDINITIPDIPRLKVMMGELIDAMRFRLMEMGVEEHPRSTRGSTRISATASKRIVLMSILMRWQMVILSKGGEYRAALAQADDVLRWVRRVGDRKGEARCLNILARVYADQNERAKQVETLRKGIASARLTDDLPLLIPILHNLSTVLVLLGEYDEAEAACDEALALTERTPEEFRTKELGYLWALKGRLLTSRQQRMEGLRYLHLARKSAEKQNDFRQQYVIQANLSVLYLRLGFPRYCIEYALEMLELGRELQNPRFRAQAMLRLGMAYNALNDLEKGRKVLHQLMEDYSEFKALFEGDAAVTLGELALKAGDYSEARHFLRVALEYYRSERTNIPSLSANATLLLGRTALAEGLSRESEECFQEALRIYRADGGSTNIMRALGCLGELRVTEGREEEADAFFTEALELAGGDDTRATEITVHQHLLEMKSSKGLYREGLEHSRELLRLQDVQLRQEGEIALQNARIIHEVDMLEQQVELERLQREEAEAELQASRQDLRGASISLTDKGELLRLAEREIVHAIERLQGNGHQEVVDNLKSVLNEINSRTALNEPAMEYMNRIEEEFFVALRSRHPGLTAGQIRLCGLIRSGLMSSDIASVLHITQASLKKGRNRLRRKLGLGSGVRLETYLGGIELEHA